MNEILTTLCRLRNLFIFALHEWKNAMFDFPIDQHCFNPTLFFHVSQFPLSLANILANYNKDIFLFIALKPPRHNKSNSPPILLSTLAEALMTLLFFFIKIFRAHYELLWRYNSYLFGRNSRKILLILFFAKVLMQAEMSYQK